MRITPLDAWMGNKIGQPHQRLTRKALEAYQLQALRRTLELARAKSRFYSEHLAKTDLDAIQSLEDIRFLTFTTAEDIRAEALRFLCVSQGEVSRVVTLDTSGTTGNPKRVYFTGEDQQLTIDFFHHGMSTLVSPGDRVMILLPGERPGSVGDLLQTGLERLGAYPIPYGIVSNPCLALEAMANQKPSALVGIPSQVLSLAKHSQGKVAPRAVLLSTDHVPMAICREFERIWNCEVFTHYGMAEMGFGGGVECEAHRGYHLREADLLFEVIHPETGEPVDDGEIGEVVFTTLTRRGMPLIRYRTGDLSRFVPGPCPCGTSLKTLERVKNRISSRIVITGQGTLTLADLDEAIFALPPVLDFIATLSCEGDREQLHIALKLIEGDIESTVQPLYKALDAIPAIRSGKEKGVLQVLLTATDQEGFLSRGAGKRSIIDKRVTPA